MLRRLSVVLALVAIPIVTGGATASGSPGNVPAIVFERDGDLFAIAVDVSRTVRLTRTRGREYTPAASFDGRSIAYARDEPSGIWAMRADGSMRRRLTRGADSSPTWAPDGRTIFFDRSFKVMFGATCSSIFRVGADGRGLRRVTRSGNSDAHYDADVSPDGRRIAFTHANQCEGGTTSYALRVVDTAGRQTSDLSRLEGNAFFPARPEYEAPTWSHDGSRIAFLGDLQLGIASRDGSRSRYLIPRRFSASDPEWSPDGRWIAFVTYEGQELYVVRPNGSGMRRLTRTRSSESSPTWLRRLPG